MNFGRNLTDLNRRLAIAVRDTFPDNTTAEQSAEGTLILRDKEHHDLVEVHLEDGVLAALDFAMPLQREVLTRRLIADIAARVRAEYRATRPGKVPLRVVGTSEML